MKGKLFVIICEQRCGAHNEKDSFLLVLNSIK